MLRLSGLRSYRIEQQIDFSNFNIMAIVGDTGAGKSSILEALCVALYGCCSWDARSAKHLIADGSTTLRVQLTFRVGKETWRVTRAISKGAYPPPVHLLEGLDDGTRVDGGDQVNAMVSRILGLDFATFLKSVVLPQGRFQILLQMSNTDRTLILKSILGLDQLTAVRDSASDLSNRLRPQLAALKQRRALLLPEPASVAREARATIKAISAEIDRLVSIRSKVADARLAQSQASSAANIAIRAADRIDEATVVGLVEKFYQIVSLNDELEAVAQPIVEEVLFLTNLEREFQQVLDDAAVQRVGLAELAAAAATIVAAIRDLPELESEHVRCEEETTTIKTEDEDLTARIAALTEIEIAAGRAEADAQSYAAAEKHASLQFEEARAALLTARLARQAVVDANLSVVQGRMKLEKLKNEALDTAAHAKAAEQSHAVIVEQLDALRRAEAAAHAASACRPGDACPICDRTLPDDFVAPTTPGEDVLLKAYASSEKEVKAKNKKAVAAATNLEASVIELDAALVGELEAVRRAKASEQDAFLLLGVESLDAPDKELLSKVEAAVAAANVALIEAQRNAWAKRQYATRADAEIQPVSEAIRDRKEALARARAALSRRTTKQRETLAELPPIFSIVGPYGVPALRENSHR